MGRCALPDREPFREPAAQGVKEHVVIAGGREFNTLKDVSHRNLPRIYDVNPPDRDFHVKMEYIPGPTLEALRVEFPWPIDRWWRLAEGLTRAVVELERRQVLHRDPAFARDGTVVQGNGQPLPAALVDWCAPVPNANSHSSKAV